MMSNEINGAICNFYLKSLSNYPQKQNARDQYMHIGGGKKMVV